MKKTQVLLQLTLFVFLMSGNIGQVLAQDITPTNKDWSHGSGTSEVSVYVSDNLTNASGQTASQWKTDVDAALTTANHTDWSGSAPFNFTAGATTGTVAITTTSGQTGSISTSTSDGFQSSSGGTGIKIDPGDPNGSNNDNTQSITITFAKKLKAFYFDLLDMFDSSNNDLASLDISVSVDGVKVWQIAKNHHVTGGTNTATQLDGDGNNKGTVQVGQNLENGVGLVKNSGITTITITMITDHNTGSSSNRDAVGLDNFWFPTTTLLPVEFAGFDASLIDEDNVLLEWSTASEENNSHFEVERSADGLTWSYIGQVAGAGNSTTILHYTYTDDLTGGLNYNQLYYRLKQIDFDGTFDYSTVRAVNPPGGMLNLYPNPVQQNTPLTIGHKEAIWEARVYDVHGQLVLHKQYDDNPAKYVDLDISELRTGIMYFIRVNGVVSGATGKFVVN